MSGDTVEFATRRFSTDALPEPDRLPVWHDEFGRSLVNVEIDPISDEPFRADATVRIFSDVRTLAVCSSAARHRRTSAMAASGDDSIGLIVSCGAGNFASAQGSELSLAEGEASMVLTNEPGVLLGRRHLGIIFPREALASRLKNIEDAAMRPIGASSEPLRLLVSYLNGLPDGLSLRETALRRITLDHIYDLAALAICPERPLNESYQRSVAAARLRTAFSYIAAHFHEPNLSVAAVALDQGVSSRYLQRLFETTGVTFTEHVTDLRLQRAFTLLTEARDHRCRISDIALQVGFSDVSHFNRLFRKRFGDSPSGILSQYRG